MPENLENDQLNRLWSHKQHVDNLFYERLNYFLIFESILLGVVGVLYSRPGSVVIMLKMITLLGLLITIIWLYIQARSKYIRDVVGRRARELIPEYKTTEEVIAQRKWPVSGAWLLTYVIPLLVLLIWIFLLIFL